jgi:hypothetical protein
MTEALTPPFLLAAAVLLVAGAAKLRAPAGAVRALITLGVPTRAAYVRMFAVAEIALGADCALAPTRAGAVALGLLYGLFALITALLARRRASCGCFGAGQGDSPASPAQSLISGLLAIVAAACALQAPHSVGWVLARPVPTAAALSVGIVGAAYAAVLAYTLLPQAWSAWSTQ